MRPRGVAPCGAREGGDRAGLVARDLLDDAIERERLLGEEEGAA